MKRPFAASAAAAICLGLPFFSPTGAAAGWLPLRQLDTTPAGCPAVSSAGNSVLMSWYRPGEYAAQWRLADGSTQNLRWAANPGTCPAVALGGNDRAVLVSSDVTVGVFGEFHFFGVTVSILDGGNPPTTAPVRFVGDQELFGPPVVAVSPRGEVLVAWIEYETSYEFDRRSVRARVRSASGRWGEIQTLSPEELLPYDLTTAYTTEGTALLVWKQYDSGAETAQIVRIEKTEGLPFGTIRPVSRVVPAWYLFASGGSPLLAVGADGYAAVSWFEGFGRRTRLRVRPPEGPFGPILTPVEGSSIPRDLAIGPGGKTYFNAIESRSPPGNPGGFEHRWRAFVVDPITAKALGYTLSSWTANYLETAGTALTSDGSWLALARRNTPQVTALASRLLQPGAGQFGKAVWLTPPRFHATRRQAYAADANGHLYVLSEGIGGPNLTLQILWLSEYLPETPHP
ncbi:MAG TPA: hypothetical protein VGS22_15255 [Thermoanaerobaculia bacterium]|jgi:hypothetical protein|nr:hypothetical protein [Thermoanaerobaculia bacterium]